MHRLGIMQNEICQIKTMQNRQKAILWWDNISSLEQKIILKKHNLGYRKPSSVTGREIEEFWNKRFQEIAA